MSSQNSDVVEKTERKRQSKKIDWTQESVLTLIDIIKANKPFWDPRQPQYSNKVYRQKILERIQNQLELLHQFVVTPTQITNKWQSLKTYFSSCSQKLIKSTRSGVDTDEVEDLTFNPSWEFYNHLLFLREKMAFTPSVNSFNLPDLRVLESPSPDSMLTQTSDSDSYAEQNTGNSRESPLNFPAAKKFAAGTSNSSRPVPQKVRIISQQIVSPASSPTPFEPIESSAEYDETSRPVSPVDLFDLSPSLQAVTPNPHSSPNNPNPGSSTISNNIGQTQPHTRTRKKQSKEHLNNDEIFAHISNRILDRLDNKKEEKPKYFNFGQHIVQQLEVLDEEIADDVIQVINNALYEAKKKQREKSSK